MTEKKVLYKRSWQMPYPEPSMSQHIGGVWSGDINVQCTVYSAVYTVQWCMWATKYVFTRPGLASSPTSQLAVNLLIFQMFQHAIRNFRLPPVQQLCDVMCVCQACEFQLRNQNVNDLRSQVHGKYIGYLRKFRYQSERLNNNSVHYKVVFLVGARQRAVLSFVWSPPHQGINCEGQQPLAGQGSVCCALYYSNQASHNCITHFISSYFTPSSVIIGIIQLELHNFCICISAVKNSLV